MTDPTAKPRKGGRPPNPEGKSLSKTMNFRVPPELYRQVVAAAEADGVSISEEVGRRLSQSFYHEHVYTARFGSEAVGFLANLFASILNTMQAATGRSCLGDVEMRKAASEAFDSVLASADGIFKDCGSVPALQRRFDREDFRRLIEERIDDAEFASAAPERMSLTDIMGR